MNKIYISGPITNAGKDGNKQKFHDMVMKIHEMKIGEPVSPRRHRIPPWLKLPEDKDEIWVTMMKQSIIDLMGCDSMVLLDGWKKSRGCMSEYAICKLLGIPVFDEHFQIISNERVENGILNCIPLSILRDDVDSNRKQTILLNEGMVQRNFEPEGF